MTLRQIISSANLTADEDYADVDMALFIIDAINKFNTIWPALVPSPEDPRDLAYEIRFVKEQALTPYADPNAPTQPELELRAQEEKRVKQLKVVDDIFNNRLVVQYVTYMIKVNDASKQEYEDRMREWKEDVLKIKATYGELLHEDNRLGALDELSSRRQGVALKDPRDNPYSNVSTWGPSPGGNTSKSSYRSGLDGFKVK